MCVCVCVCVCVCTCVHVYVCVCVCVCVCVFLKALVYLGYLSCMSGLISLFCTLEVAVPVIDH